jgi:hypothetical protein
MWFINFVIAIGVLLSLLLFGGITYLERWPLEARTSPITGPIPLPRRKPKLAGDSPAEVETVSEPKPNEPRKARRSARVQERW